MMLRLVLDSLVQHGGLCVEGWRLGHCCGGTLGTMRRGWGITLVNIGDYVLRPGYHFGARWGLCVDAGESLGWTLGIVMC
jgi:hypothetical protein